LGEQGRVVPALVRHRRGLIVLILAWLNGVLTHKST
jgi:hypothetical protein